MGVAKIGIIENRLNIDVRLLHEKLRNFEKLSNLATAVENITDNRADDRNKENHATNNQGDFEPGLNNCILKYRIIVDFRAFIMKMQKCINTYFNIVKFCSTCNAKQHSVFRSPQQ